MRTILFVCWNSFGSSCEQVILNTLFSFWNSGCIFSPRKLISFELAQDSAPGCSPKKRRRTYAFAWQESRDYCQCFNGNGQKTFTIKYKTGFPWEPSKTFYFGLNEDVGLSASNKWKPVKWDRRLSEQARVIRLTVLFLSELTDFHGYL